jgi:LEA14-like dessication related protein
MLTKTLLAALAVVGLAVAGCAGIGQQIEPPEVFVVGLEPLQGGNFEQRFRIDLRVQNPNDFELEINGLDFELDLNGIRLTRGLSNEVVTIPRLGEAIVPVSATTTVFDLVRQVINAPSLEGVEYEVRGRLFLSNPPQGSVEFHRSGRMFR